MSTRAPETLLWLADNRGVYIPRDFAGSFKDRATHVKNVSDENWAILDAGPDHEEYWDAWAEVCDSAIVTDEQGYEYHLYQDGDLWLVPVGWEWSEEEDMFVDPDKLKE